MRRLRYTLRSGPAPHPTRPRQPELRLASARQPGKVRLIVRERDQVGISVPRFGVWAWDGRNVEDFNTRAEAEAYARQTAEYR